MLVLLILFSLILFSCYLVNSFFFEEKLLYHKGCVVEEVSLVNSRKAQSSVEYLTTFAWAFIGLLVTVGTLSYFGLFDSAHYTPESCHSGTQILCADTALYMEES